jgi:hypothetical protein
MCFILVHKQTAKGKLYLQEMDCTQLVILLVLLNIWNYSYIGWCKVRHNIPFNNNTFEWMFPKYLIQYIIVHTILRKELILRLVFLKNKLYWSERITSLWQCYILTDEDSLKVPLNRNKIKKLLIFIIIIMTTHYVCNTQLRGRTVTFHALRGCQVTKQRRTYIDFGL